MKKVKLIYTGGTIGGDLGENPNATASYIQSDLVPTIFRQYVDEQVISNLKEQVEIELVAPILKFSEEMNPADWAQIAKCICRSIESEGPDGIVIAHGTDTMAYTASALSFMLPGLKCPVIVTGSNKPITQTDSDAKQNLADAIIAALDERLKGVFVCFSGIPNRPSTLHLGTRVRKIAFEGDCFRSVNVDVIGHVRTSFFHRLGVEISNKALVGQLEALNRNKTFTLREARRQNIAFFQVFPGFKFPAVTNEESAKDWQSYVKRLNVIGIVIELYNAGTACTEGKYSILPLIRAATELGAPVFFTSQQKGIVELDVYPSSNKLKGAGGIGLKDMIREAAIPKLMWAGGQIAVGVEQKSQATILTEIMRQNLAGEITLE